MWDKWPHNEGQRDTGIDLVAQKRDSSEWVAIQCKFYREGVALQRDNIDSFLVAYEQSHNGENFAEGIVVSTTNHWGKNAEAALKGRDKPVARWGIDVFENSSIDWERSSLASLRRKETKQLRDYQQQAFFVVIKVCSLSHPHIAHNPNHAHAVPH